MSTAMSGTSELRRHSPSLKELDKVQQGCLSWKTGCVYLYTRAVKIVKQLTIAFLFLLTM
jgi:hypothetical protein